MRFGAELQSVTKRYGTRSTRWVRAVEGVSLTAYAGEVLGLLGPSGSGKSTLLGLLEGSVRPTAGQVRRGDAGLVLLDEPGAPPDRHPDAAVVLATVRVANAHAYCDRVAVLKAGRLVKILRAASLAPLAEQSWYEIRVQGHLAPHLASWFDGLTMSATAAGETLLVGPVADQAALHGYLLRVRDLGLPLISVHSVEPDLDLWLHA